jgi:hypothetical protein
VPHWDSELDVTGKPPGRNTVLYVSEEAKDKGKKVSDTFKGSLDHATNLARACTHSQAVQSTAASTATTTTLAATVSRTSMAANARAGGEK